ncbi:MAG TPA: NAD-dependent epimerase/dehydratase family protein [Terracidiphilus sp.]|jgi:nucleoside-diphosphate-sugar epimerase
MTIRKAVVTGATGFIGSALCKRLINSGVAVHAVSRTPPAALSARPGQPELSNVEETRDANITWWKADISEIDAARKIIQTVLPDVTFHLASLVTGARGLEFVLPTCRNNFLAALNVLIASAESNPGRVILSNSFEEPDAENPIPCSPYAAAKSCSSAYAQMLHTLYRLPVVTAKIYMVYGPGQTDHTKLIPYVTRSLLQGEPVKLSSGARSVDWIYIDDVVEGLIRCAETPGIDGAEVELGSGEFHSIRTVVQELFEILKSPNPPNFGTLPDRPLERMKKADIAQSAKLIGWVPRTEIGAGLRSTVDWYRREMGLNEPENRA